MADIIYSDEALADISRAYDDYESRQHGLGDRFVGRLETLTETIGRMPELFGEVYSGVRAGMPKKFPFVVYYRIKGNTVDVVAVLHGATDPAVWQSRL